MSTAGSQRERAPSAAEREEAQTADIRTGPMLSSERAELEVSPTVASSPGGELASKVSGHAGDLPEGTLLDEHYRVIRPLGRGGMGTVYLVEHTKLGRKFAAKVVSDLLASDPVLLARLSTEARVASRLRHENIVDVTHLGETSSGALFIVMELLEGEDLRALIAEHRDRDRRVDFGLVRSLAEDLMAGLTAAHAQGVVHRDLKPENVFLVKTERGRRAKIVDFGIAKSGPADEDLGLTQTGQIIGTPLYMSPEQARNTAGVDTRSDQYSLGVVLFELITGHLPFDARSAYDLIVKHATEPPRPLRLLRDDVPASVEAVVLRCLAKRPEDRFADVVALRDAWREAWETASSDRRDVARTDPPGRRSPPIAHDESAPRTFPETSAPAQGGAGLRLVGAVAVGVALLAIAALLGSRWSAADPTPDTSEVSPRPLADPVVPSPDPADPPPEPLVGLDPPAIAEPHADVVRTLHTRPEGATVLVGDDVLCTTPCPITLPEGQPVEVALRLRGHRRATATIDGASLDEVIIPLEPQRAVTERPPELAPR